MDNDPFDVFLHQTKPFAKKIYQDLKKNKKIQKSFQDEDLELYFLLKKIYIVNKSNDLEKIITSELLKMG